jgi:hypothetical protein
MTPNIDAQLGLAGVSATGYAERPRVAGVSGLFGRVMGFVALTIGFGFRWRPGSAGGRVPLAAGFRWRPGVPLAAGFRWRPGSAGGRVPLAAGFRWRPGIPLAAGIFLDILNVFLLLLRLFGRSSRARRAAPGATRMRGYTAPGVTR